MIGYINEDSATLASDLLFSTRMQLLTFHPGSTDHIQRIPHGNGNNGSFDDDGGMMQPSGWILCLSGPGRVPDRAELATSVSERGDLSAGKCR
jgi:hypothetical protein